MRKGPWLAITCSKNDGDMIEAFIRGNSQFIDKFVIMDDSTDHTVEIVKLLVREGFDIELVKKPGLIANQREKTNHMYQKFANPRKFSAVVPLDVDEILVSKDSDYSKSEAASSKETNFLPWLPFAPVTLGWSSLTNPLQLNFIGVSNQMDLVRKIFIPSSQISKQGFIEVGAHNYFIKGEPVAFADHPHLAIAHFPVRSREQMISKILIQLTSVRVKRKKLKGESTHLQAIARHLLVPNGYSEIQNLQLLAAFYANFKSGAIQTPNAIVTNDWGNLLPVIEIKYPDLATVDLVSNLVKLIDELTHLVMDLEEIPARDDRPYRFV